jgi:hypothetical protein
VKIEMDRRNLVCVLILLGVCSFLSVKAEDPAPWTPVDWKTLPAALNSKYPAASSKSNPRNRRSS